MEQTIASKLQKLKSLPILKQKAAATILGSIVADAAAKQLHWVYDLAKLDTEVGQAQPEFFSKSVNGFYVIPPGHTSPYSDIQKVLLKSLAKNNTFDLKDYQSELVEAFGNPESTYQKSFVARNAYKQQLETDGKKWDTPVDGPWITQTTLKFLDNLNQNKEITGCPTSDDTEGFSGVIALAAYQVSQQKFDKKQLLQAINVFNTKEVNVAYALSGINIIKHLIEGTQEENIVEQALKSEQNTDVQKQLEQVIEKVKSQAKYRETVSEFGKACPNPGNYKGSVLLIQTATEYTDAIRQTILAGGDNCSRSVFVGAALAARHGLDAIPESWVQQTYNHEIILDQLIKLFS